MTHEKKLKHIIKALDTYMANLKTELYLLQETTDYDTNYKKRLKLIKYITKRINQKAVDLVEQKILMNDHYIETIKPHPIRKKRKKFEHY